MRKQRDYTCLESQEIAPHELRPGQQLQTSWGFSEIESVEISDTHYTVTARDNGKTTIKCAIGNWPFISTGRFVKRSHGSMILRDGTRF